VYSVSSKLVEINGNRLDRAAWPEISPDVPLQSRPLEACWQERDLLKIRRRSGEPIESSGCPGEEINSHLQAVLADNRKS
jgi:hypothetical protein